MPHLKNALGKDGFSDHLLDNNEGLDWIEGAPRIRDGNSWRHRGPCPSAAM